jgi:hypothetical protein
VRVEWLRGEPTPLQARAWRRLWQILLAPEPSSPAQEPTPYLMAHDGGAEDGAGDPGSDSKGGRPRRAHPQPAPHRTRNVQSRRRDGRGGPRR